MNLNFMWEAAAILIVGFCLSRIIGKKTVGEMTGLEIITLLAMASMIGHAVSEQVLWKTIVALCIFVTLLVTIQFLALKFDWMENWFMGSATLVIQDGQLVMKNLKKLRLSVDQLEARLREKGISSYTEIQTATIEISGQLGYEWKRQAKPVTVGELEQVLALLQLQPLPPQVQDGNLFSEVINHRHSNPVPPKFD